MKNQNSRWVKALLLLAMYIPAHAHQQTHQQREVGQTRAQKEAQEREQRRRDEETVRRMADSGADLALVEFIELASVTQFAISLVANREKLVMLELHIARLTLFSPRNKQPTVRMPSRKEDKVITAAAKSDPDAQPLTPKQLKAMVPLRSLRGRPKSENKKLLVSVRYSPEVFAYFKSTGEGWQSRMDRVLRQYVERHSRST